MKSIYCALILVHIVPLFLMGQPEIPQWHTYEISLTSDKAYPNPYLNVDVWSLFINEKGDSLKRPAFWDGGNSWKIRFAPIDDDGQWRWTTYASDKTNPGLHHQSGSLVSTKNEGGRGLQDYGPLKMSQGHRSMVHHSGKPFLMVGDTPWAMPFRASREQVLQYAKDRQNKGFNMALLMSVQPDTKANGPEARNTPQGFARGFFDLSEGHINEINPDYFNFYDSMVKILLDHNIVPAHQPIFHGFGWKGKKVLGITIVPEEYVRFNKYLLARYGSYPALWLVAADHNGLAPGVYESGLMLEQWDAYQQPTGIHYNPCDDYLAKWAKDKDNNGCFHYNKTHQEEAWLDFQWAQTGHDGKHRYHKVGRMYHHFPIKGVANGEPTYEGMNAGKNGLGWWQGEEAWMQLMHGGNIWGCQPLAMESYRR